MNKKNIALICSVFILLVACGKKDSSSGPGANGTSVCAKLPCFYSVETENGNLGGISGADALCQTEYPTAKAFIASESNRQVIPTKIDWVLEDNTAYYQVDGTLIGTTTSEAIFSFNLSSPFINQVAEYWTGMEDDWKSQNVNNCGEWTNDITLGKVGLGNQTDNDAIKAWDQNCNRTDMKLLCVAH